MHYLLILFLTFIVSACSKEPESIPFEKLDLPENKIYRDVFLTSEGRLVICGSEGQKGFIMHSDDLGQTWTSYGGTLNHAVNALHFVDANVGFCADGDVIIRRTEDGGVTWSPFYDTTWPLTVNRKLRSIWFTTPEKGFVCGGKNLGNGVMYTTINSGNEWTWSEFEHEYRSVCFSDSLNGIVCGHGSLLYTSDGGISFSNGNITNHYFTGATCDQRGYFSVCDLNGRVFRSNTPGGTWIQIRNGSDWSVRSGQLNSIAVSPSGKIAAAGPGGFLTWSNDNGASWNDRLSFNSSDIHKVKWLDDHTLVCAGQNGIYLTRIF